MRMLRVPSQRFVVLANLVRGVLPAVIEVVHQRRPA
jgi:hypothetical protein